MWQENRGGDIVMDMKEKMKVIANLGDHITYKEDIGICYDSALAKVIEDAYMTLKNGVTVQECVRGYWDVCNNNGNIQYRCPHCETVYVYMYKNHIAPDVCKECGARLYLPQPPKGE
jgi:hypothetical protein